VSAGEGSTRPQLAPLEMAQNAAGAVLRHADEQIADPTLAYVNRSGHQGHEAAFLAGSMALVSIAESLDRLVELAEQIAAATVGK
jgi:hypothetical protein